MSQPCTDTVFYEGTENDSFSSEIASTAIPFGSTLFWQYNPAMSSEISEKGYTANAIKVDYNNASSDEKAENVSKETEDCDKALPTWSKSLYPLTNPPDIVSSVSGSGLTGEYSKYSTQEIERSLSATQVLLREFERLDRKQSDHGFDTWNELKLRLKLLEARLTSPTPNVKAQYLYDVNRFKARVASCVLRYEKEFKNFAPRPHIDSYFSYIPRTLSPQLLPFEAIFPRTDELSRKRRRLSSSDDSNIVKSTSSPDVCADTASSISSVSSSEAIDTFLDQLGDEIYVSILADLCPDNMRGSFCKQPMSCIEKGRLFACPEFAIHQFCLHEKDQVLSHAGYKHTAKGCTAHHWHECRMRHADGKKCRTRVAFFHIRASCMSVRGSTYTCRSTPCNFGHDEPAIRRAVMATVQ